MSSSNHALPAVPRRHGRLRRNRARGSPDSRVRLKLQLRLLPAVVVVLLAVQLLTPYRVWLILLVGLGGAWVFAYLWAWSLGRGLRLEREMRFGWGQVGDQLQERFTLSNRSWTPGLWVEIVDQSTLPGANGHRIVVVGARGGSRRWRITRACTRRGLFTLGPTSLRSGDPLGIYTVRVEIPDSTTLLVTPPVVPLPTIQVSPGGQVGAGRPRPQALERIVSNAGLREYLPGDSLRRIHWPTTARQRSLFVRVLEGSSASNWWIFLDLDERVQVGVGQDSTLEHGIILAASLADRGLQHGHRVGLVAHGRDLIWLPPEARDRQRLSILRALAMADTGARPLADLLTLARPAVGQLASLIVITPAADDAWLGALASPLRCGAVATALLLDPVSYGGQGSADLAASTLAKLGVSRYVVTRELLDQPATRPGRQGRWEWRTTPSGRSVALSRPTDPAWRELR